MKPVTLGLWPLNPQCPCYLHSTSLLSAETPGPKPTGVTAGTKQGQPSTVSRAQLGHTGNLWQDSRDRGQLDPWPA